MPTRLIGTDSENPRLPQGVIDATQGTTAADVAPGDTLAQAIAYADSVVGGEGGGMVDETVDTDELYRVILFSDGTTRAIPITAEPPDTPTGFARTARINSVKLTWTAASGATSYIVYRDGSQYATTTTNRYRDGAVTVGETYSYAVLAVSFYGLRSDQTSTLTAFIDPALNVAPTVEVRSWPATVAVGNKAIIRVNAVDVDGQTLAAILNTDVGSLVATTDPTVWTLDPA